MEEAAPKELIEAALLHLAPGHGDLDDGEGEGLDSLVLSEYPR